MLIISESIVVSAPRWEVWRFCEDVANTPRWNPLFVRQELVEADQVAVGVEIRSVARVLWRTIVADSEVTRFDPPSRSEVRSSNPIPTIGSYIFDEEPDGTRFTWQVIIESGLGGVFGRLPDAVVIVAARWQLRRGLRRLRALLEERPGSVPPAHQVPGDTVPG